MTCNFLSCLFSNYSIKLCIELTFITREQKLRMCGFQRFFRHTICTLDWLMVIKEERLWWIERMIYRLIMISWPTQVLLFGWKNLLLFQWKHFLALCTFLRNVWSWPWFHEIYRRSSGRFLIKIKKRAGNFVFS